MLTPHIERLERLRALLASKAEEEVDLSTWAYPCGTVFCAVGWATQDPDFQKEGLKLGHTINSLRGPKFGELDDWHAVEAFFGLTPGQAECLFMPYRLSDEFYHDGRGTRQRLDADKADTQQGAVLARLDTFIANVKVSQP